VLAQSKVGLNGLVSGSVAKVANGPFSRLGRELLTAS
jgi:hypothetical protein